MRVFPGISAIALICLLPLLAFAGEPASRPSAPASPTDVPAALLTRLRAQYIPEDARTPGISESDKVRRYEAILREGGYAERLYAKATNLHEVRILMMAAAKGMATLDGTAESRQLVTDIARRIANSNAPADSRVMAEMLFMRARIDELAAFPAEAADELSAFVARYHDTPGEAKALVSAAELCRIADADASRHTYLRQLADKHFSAPGVSEFLEVEGLNPYLGRLMAARLTRLDGTTLTLPRDTLGKFTVVHFWSVAKSGLVNHTDKGDVSLAPLYKPLRDAGVEFIGVNLDADRGRFAKFIRDGGEGINWTQTCSGLGLQDPTFLRYRVPAMPAYWLIGPDGRVVSNSFFRGVQDWPGYSGSVQNSMVQLSELTARTPYYRSGEFLLDLPAMAQSAPPGAADIPSDQLNALRQKVLLPPALGLSKDKKAAAFREALELGQTLEQKHGTAANLPVVQNILLVAARWLANETADKNAAKLAHEIAARILASKADVPQRLLADYVRTSTELAAAEISLTDSARRINTFVEQYAKSDVSWAAGALGLLLATECGDEDTRTSLMVDLRGQLDQHPRVCGFLRDYCNVNVDARTTQSQPQISSNVPRELRGEPPRLDGGTLRLEDLRGKLVMIHFWSIACPAFANIEIKPGQRLPGGMAPDPDNDLIVVGVNLDRSRDEVEKYLKAHEEYKGWIHIFSGQGQNDPLAGDLDVYGLPRSVFLDRDGAIFRWGRPAQMGDLNFRRMPARPRPRTAFTGPRIAGIGPVPGAPDKSGAADLPKELSLDLAGKTAMKLALIPAGEFRTYPSQSDRQYLGNDPPQRRSFVNPKRFYMGIHHVTRGQFAAFVQQTHYKTEAEQEGWALVWNRTWQKVEGASWLKPGFDQDDDHPVVCVSWNDAVEFCAWIGRTTGKTVALPTEERWEYACRAGASTLFAWGSHPSEGNGWCNLADKSAAKTFPGWLCVDWDDGYVFTSPAGKFKPNAFGLYDMTGNAWQWCAEWYDPLEQRRVQVDPSGSATGTYRVARGGSWNSGPDYCRPSIRRKESPTTGTNTVGFRVVVEAP